MTYKLTNILSHEHKFVFDDAAGDQTTRQNSTKQDVLDKIKFLG